ncbi:asparaginase domain-containing protein [Shigella flexneri]
MTPKTGSILRKTLKRIYDDYDGFVILHGTDTMAFTASALSFMLENLASRSL